MEPELCFFNGINGDDGRYFQEPMACGDLAEMLLDRRASNANHPQELEPKGLEFGRSPSQIGESGWGIIFPKEVDPKIVKALNPLLKHRKEQATLESEKRFAVFNYHPGESKYVFLKAMGAPDPGMPVDPDRMPYYLLLVGSPQEIPFEFQYRLSNDYAVGRICFDTPEDYGVYAKSVVDWENQQPKRKKYSLTMFGVSNPNDIITGQTTKYLIEPLHQDLATDLANWNINKHTGDNTTKCRLTRLLGGPETPDILFSVAHGLCYKKGHPLQKERQGGLVCREWPGPKAAATMVTGDMWFGAPDLGNNADLHGLIMFQMGCFTAGTPKLDVLRKSSKKYTLAAGDFVAVMPKGVMSYGHGGALTVIDNVDREWE